MSGPAHRGVRPGFREWWQVPNGPKLWVIRKRTDQKLTKEAVYWVATSSKTEGRAPRPCGDLEGVQAVIEFVPMIPHAWRAPGCTGTLSTWSSKRRLFRV